MGGGIELAGGETVLFLVAQSPPVEHPKLVILRISGDGFFKKGKRLVGLLIERVRLAERHAIGRSGILLSDFRQAIDRLRISFGFDQQLPEPLLRGRAFGELAIDSNGLVRLLVRLEQSRQLERSILISRIERRRLPKMLSRFSQAVLMSLRARLAELRGSRFGIQIESQLVTLFGLGEIS